MALYSIAYVLDIILLYLKKCKKEAMWESISTTNVGSNNLVLVFSNSS